MADKKSSQDPTSVAVASIPQPTTIHGLPVVTFNREQIDLIKRTVAKGTSDDELSLFLYQAKHTGLDPLAGQIHCVKRGQGPDAKCSFQTAIDGYRLIADRTRQYAGNDDPIFDDEANPTKATVTVYKIVGAQKCAFTATARWDQYYPGDKQGFMWKKMPHLMLGKCAEALALRKAFPAELSGVYVNEEMEQATEPPKAEFQPPVLKPQAPEELLQTTLIVATISQQKITSKSGIIVRYAVTDPNNKVFVSPDVKFAEEAKKVQGTASHLLVKFVPTGNVNEVKTYQAIIEAEA